jgi:hypothetical protein
MPHAFKASPKHPAVAYLIRLHADLGGRIIDNKREAGQLVESVKHVEAVIRLFDPDFNFQRIAARRRVTGNPWFKRGTVFRHALEAIRMAREPLTAREVVEHMLAAKGVSNATPKAVVRLIASVHSSLMNHKGKSVVKVLRSGEPVRWQNA